MGEAAEDVGQLIEAGFTAASPRAEQHRRELLVVRSSEGRTSLASSVDAAGLLDLARTYYRGVAVVEWREGAGLEDWAAVYRHTHAMRSFDLLAATVHNRVEEEVRRRFDVDIRGFLVRYLQQSCPPRSARDEPEPVADGLGCPSAQPSTGDVAHRGVADDERHHRSGESEPGRAEVEHRASRPVRASGTGPAGVPDRSGSGPEVGSSVGNALTAARVLQSARLREVHIAKLLVDEMLPEAPASARAIAADRLANASAAAATAAEDVERAAEALRAPAVLPGDGGPPAQHFTDADEWVRLWLLPRWRPHAAVPWCPRWWAHPEATSRIEAIWRAWRDLCVAEGVGLSLWWRDHADYHLGVLTSANGPFAGCAREQDQHQEVDLLPAVKRPHGAVSAHRPEVVALARVRHQQARSDAGRSSRSAPGPAGGIECS